MMYMLQSAVILMLGALVGAKSVSTTLGTFAQTTVYSGNSAEVERVVTIDDSLPVNEYHTIAVSGFSERIIEETLRITGEADVEVLDVKLSSVQTPRQHFPEYKTHLAKLTEELDGQQKTIQHLDNDQQRCDTRLGSVAAFVADGFNRPSIPAATESGSATSVKPRLSIAEMGEILDFQSKEQLRCHEQQLTVQPQRDAANRRIEELSINIDQLNGYSEYREGGVYLPVSRNEKVLEFRVLLKKARPTLSFLVTYMATTATWSPEYDIRIESKAGVDGNDKVLSTSNGAVKQYRMEIDYFANVRQSTGEHWTDTRLVLSTANLAFLNAAPESRQQGLKFHGTRGEDDHDYWTFNDGVVKEHYQFLNRKVAPQQKGNVKTHMHMRSAPDGAAAPQFLNVAADSMQSAVSVRTGDLSASHKFEVQYPVSVSSADLVQRQLPVGSVASSQKHLILVDKVSVDARVFSYVVPSADTSAYRMGWGQYALTSDQSAAAGGGAAGKQLSPLLASTTARVFIQGDNTGSVRFEAVQPGETIRMNLGTDRNIQVSTRKVMPVFKGEEEDRSTWFVRDKRKFRVRTEERTTSVRSSYPASEQEAVLVIVSENLPSSTVVDEITVELLSASLKSLLQLDGQGNVRGEGSSDATEPSSNNAYLEAILKRETAAPASSASGAPAAPTAYYCKSSGNIYWAVWLRGGQSVSIPYKYKVTWPAEKNLESM